MRMEREIKIAKEISEESFKMEALPLEDVEMLEAVEDGLSMVLASATISLNLNQELMQFINGHGAILRVSPETEADLVMLLRHCLYAQEV
jgi:menaquinone-dependent protoporphyrinogen IX oxidase